MEHVMVLADDGTLDTVIRCHGCGAEYRYNFDFSECDGCEQTCYADSVTWAIEDAGEVHAEELGA